MTEGTIHEHGILDGGPHSVQDPTPQQGGDHSSDDGDPPKGEVNGFPPHPKQLMRRLHPMQAEQVF